MMAEDRFWTLIDESRERASGRPRRKSVDFLDAHIKELRPLLQKLTPAELVAYQERFDSYRDMAYRWDIWGAAYWMGGGCSDDGFLDFRSCLISLGREMFFRALDDPDSLADLVDRPDVPYMQAEGFQYVAWKLYKEKTGEESMPLPEKKRRGSYEPKGRRFDFEDEEKMARRYPRLVERLPDMGD